MIGARWWRLGSGGIVWGVRPAGGLRGWAGLGGVLDLLGGELGAWERRWWGLRGVGIDWSGICFASLGGDVSSKFV